MFNGIDAGFSASVSGRVGLKIIGRLFGMEKQLETLATVGATLSRNCKRSAALSALSEPV